MDRPAKVSWYTDTFLTSRDTPSVLKCPPTVSRQALSTCTEDDFRSIFRCGLIGAVCVFPAEAIGRNLGSDFGARREERDPSFEFARLGPTSNPSKDPKSSRDLG